MRSIVVDICQYLMLFLNSVREYLDGGGVNEAGRCLRELNVPSFSFHFVKEVIYVALEVRNDAQREQLRDLLSAERKTWERLRNVDLHRRLCRARRPGLLAR